MENFFERKESILAAFDKAKQEMGELNADISQRIEDNNKTISSVQAENKELSGLISSNNASIKSFTKFFGA